MRNDMSYEQGRTFIWESFNQIRGSFDPTIAFKAYLFILHLVQRKLVTIESISCRSIDVLLYDAVSNSNNTESDTLQKILNTMDLSIIQERNGVNIWMGVVRNLIDIDHDWYDTYYARLFDDLLDRYVEFVGRGNAEGIKQPEEITQLVCSLSKYNGGSVYNPFAGTCSYGIALENTHEYIAQEINQSTWTVGVLRLLAHGINPSSYLCEDSLYEWKSQSPDYPYGKSLFDLIVATPPFAVRINSNIGSECEPYNRTTTVEEVFIHRGLSGLNDHGKLIGVFTTGILFRGANTQFFREEFIDKDLLESVVLLPSNLFPYTAISTAILLFNKNKSRKGFVKFIDGANFFSKGKNRNILNYKELLVAIADDSVEYVRYISNAEIAENDYNLNPTRYFQEEEIVPAGYKKITLLDVSSIITGSKPISSNGRIVNIGDLSSNSLECIKNVEDLSEGEIKPNQFRLIEEPVLLLSMVRTLKPTYIYSSPSKPIYVSQNILALRVNSSAIDIPYLAYELARKSDSLQRGAVIPRFNRKEILNIGILIPDLATQDEILSKEKSDIEKIQFANKEAMVRELGLSAVIDAQKQELFTLISHRKHRINPYFSGMQDNLRMLKDELKEIGSVSLDHKISSNYTVAELLDNFEKQIADVKELFRNLTSEFVVGEKSTFNFVEFINSYNYVSKNPNLHLNVILRGDGSIEDIDREVFSSISSIKELIDIVIENAERHAFSGRDQGNIEIGYGEDGKGVYIQILNDGVPLDENFNEELSFSEGYTHGNTGNTGKGLFRAKQICLGIGANINWVNDNSSLFATGILISIKDV